MAKKVSLLQAVQNALGTFFTTAITDVDIDDHWPEPTVPVGSLKRHIAILRVGKPERQYLDPVLLDTKPVAGSDTTKAYRWEVGLLRQDFQLDVFAHTDIDRDDIDARIEEATHAGLASTLGIGNHDPVRNGLLVKVEDGWSDAATVENPFTTYADFLFEGPDVENNPELAQKNEFRSTWRGFADMVMTVVAVSPKLACVRLAMRCAESDAALAWMTPQYIDVQSTGTVLDEP